MPKKVNKTIGKCKCFLPGCDHVADIRKMKSPRRGDDEAALYLNCEYHGLVTLKGDDFQEYILTEGEFYPEGKKPELLEPEPDATGDQEPDWQPDQDKNNQVNQVKDANPDQDKKADDWW